MASIAETIERMRSVRGLHDQTARTAAIEAIVELFDGPVRMTGPTDTQRFIDIAIALLEIKRGA